MTPDLSRTQADQVRSVTRDEVMRAAKIHKRARAVEDYGFFAAIGLAVLMGLAEIAAYVAVSMGWVVRHDAPFPWLLAVLFAGCALPKTLGRATAGQVWIKLADVLGKRFGQS